MRHCRYYPSGGQRPRMPKGLHRHLPRPALEVRHVQVALRGRAEEIVRRPARFAAQRGTAQTQRLYQTCQGNGGMHVLL